MKKPMNRKARPVSPSMLAATLLPALLVLFPLAMTHAGMPRQLDGLVGSRDAVLLSDDADQILYARNADKQLIPASILKIVTSLAVLDALGGTHRISTEFYRDPENNLKVKGLGDPLLISEVLAQIATHLSRRTDWPRRELRDLILDDRYFKQPIRIPGRGLTDEPYDAPNGALNANFNTVYFKKDSRGRLVSAEPQTPLLPFVIGKIRNAGIQTGRITFSHRHKDGVLYTGHLLAYFLNRAGLPVKGRIRTGRINPADRLIYRHASRFTLQEIVQKLLEFSNNYIANQIVLIAGAKVHGPPGTLDKGLQVVRDYAHEKLGLHNAVLVEGSGIARQNRISAHDMLIAVKAFEAHHRLLRSEKKTFYKTGTLKGIRSRAGFIEDDGGRLYPFVVMLNSNPNSMNAVMRALQHLCTRQQ